MYVKSVDRTAVIAWSPNFQQQPFIATGTVSGALDASFSTNSELELFNVSLQERDPLGVKVASVPCNARFNRLSWSPHQSSILAGGLEDGTVCLWDASKLMQEHSADSALIDSKSIYGGPVRGLQFSPHSPFLLAIGSVDAQISLIDMHDTNKVYMPGPNKSQRLEDVTDLAWNPKVGHILAASSSNGLTVIWDLRAKKEALQFGVSGQRGAISSISWNPDLPNQIVCGCEDNTTPNIYSWDLRNAHSPDKQLTGHSKGVLSVAWCPKDPDLLLSSGKDNRTIFWNPKSASIIGELPAKDNWVFDVQWCPKNPDLMSVAGFDGKIDIYSFQAVSSSLTGVAQPVKSDLFAPLSPNQTTAPSSTSQSASAQTKQVPKWLKCPVGARFGFGGRLALFGPNSRKVTIHQTSGTGSTSLEQAINSNTVPEYCDQHIKSPVKDLKSTTDESSLLWTVLKVLNNPDKNQVQQDLLHLAGVTTDPQVSVTESPTESSSALLSQHSSLNTTPTIPQPSSTISTVMADAGSFRPSLEETPTSFTPQHDFFSGSTDEFDILGPKQESPVGEEPLKRRSTFSGLPFSLYSSDATPHDQRITKAIIAGNFKEAVEQCIAADRLSDALLVAVCGGVDLVARTQRIYFQKVQSPYLRVVSGILKRDLSDVIENASVSDWQDLYGLILSFSSGEEEKKRLLCCLAQRLSVEPPNHSLYPAIITYLTSGDLITACTLLVKVAKSKMPNMKDTLSYKQWLSQLFTIIRVAQLQPSSTVSLKDIIIQVPDLSRLSLHYSYLSCEEGDYKQAAMLLSMLEVDQLKRDEAVLQFADRVAGLTKEKALLSLPSAFSKLQIGTSVQPTVSSQSQYATAAQQSYQQPYQASNQSYQSSTQPTAGPSQKPSYPTSTPSQPYPSVQQPYPSTLQQQPYTSTPQQQPYPSTQQQPYPPSNPNQPQPYQQQSSQQPYPPSQPPQYGYPQSPSTQPPQVPQVPQVPQATRPTIPLPNPILSSAPLNQYNQPPPQAPPVQSNITAAEFSNNRTVTEAFNDAPIVAPRQVAASRISSAGSISPIAGSGGPQYPQYPQQQQPQPQQPPTTQSNQQTQKQQLGPADPSKILPHHLPIHQAIQQLIHDSSSASTPLQRRSIDDASRRLQTLVAQLSYQALSEPVMQKLLQMVPLINNRQYANAVPIVHELTTNHFAETGAWILGLRRLLELHQ